MTALRTLTFAAAAALIAGTAFAQAPAAPATPPNNAPAQAAAAAEPAPAAPPSAAAAAFRPLPTTGGQTLRATLEASGQFSKFLAAADKTGVAPFLVGDRQLTLMVPTDVAFESVSNFDALAAANPATELQRIVVRHLINARVTPDQVAGKKGPVPTVAQVNVEIDGSVTPMKINDAVVLQANVPATNGVIYVIDKVL